MAASDITLNIIDGIYDIQPLLRPAYSTIEIMILFILIILTIIISLYFTWKYIFSRKAIAKRKILILRAEYLNNNIDDHDCIYQLCHILKEGLKLKQLDINIPLAETKNLKKESWESFIKKISDLRYKNNINTPANLHAIFNDSLFWLKILP